MDKHILVLEDEIDHFSARRFNPTLRCRRLIRGNEQIRT